MALSTLNTVSRIQLFTFLAFCAFIGGALIYAYSPPNAMAMLRERNVPTPVIAEVTNTEHGGLFAKYLFVRMELKPEELANYRKSLPDSIPLNVPSGIQVVTADLSDSEVMKLIEQKTEIRMKHRFNNGYLPWWGIDLIENGTYHHQELADACGYEVFIDDDNSVVYVYWHYS